MFMYDKKQKILILSGTGFLVMLVLAFLLSGNFALSANLVFVGIMILFIPYAIYNFFEFKRLKQYEKEFPNFLRDLAESQRAGLTILQSIKIISDTNYGTLSPHVKKMSLQLSWNVPLEKVFDNFKKTFKGSSTITRSIMIIERANKSGANVEDIMDALAGNIEMLRDVENEKNALLSQQVLMIYAIFFIFIGISLALVKFLIPLVQTEIVSGGISTGSNIGGGISLGSSPCLSCINSNDLACFGCNTFHTVGAAFDFGEPEQTSSYFKSLFFVMIVVQAIFSGFVAGQISSDSISAGTKHSLVMFVVGVFVYLLVTRLGVV
jgi:archaeal flagellar protein FlaJ